MPRRKISKLAKSEAIRNLEFRLKMAKLKAERLAKQITKSENPAGVPIGKWIKANKVRMNRNGTVTVSVPSRRPATKRKRR